MHFHKILPFPSLPHCWLFFFEAIKKLDTLHYSNAIKKHPLMFPIIKTMTLYFDHSTYMGYETVKIKADTFQKCSRLYFIFKFEPLLFGEFQKLIRPRFFFLNVF